MTFNKLLIHYFSSVFSKFGDEDPYSRVDGFLKSEHFFSNSKDKIACGWCWVDAEVKGEVVKKATSDLSCLTYEDIMGKDPPKVNSRINIAAVFIALLIIIAIFVYF